MLPILPVSFPADPPATISIAARPDDCPLASLSHRWESPDEPARPPAVSAPESTSMLPVVSLSTPAGSSATISSAASLYDGPPASSIHRQESLDEPARPLTVPAPVDIDGTSHFSGNSCGSAHACQRCYNYNNSLPDLPGS